MRFNKKKTSEVLEGDLTPMIDMVFQLIAFFMLLINFSEVDLAEDMQLPVSTLAVAPESRPDYQIILNLRPDGKVTFAGQEIEKISVMNVIFDQEIDFARREGVTNPGDIAVIIRSHRDTPTGLVQELIAKCQASELQNFSLRVKDTP
jgi:biopolymer transport protein ExbD